MNAPRTMPTMPTTEPPLGRRTTRAAFGLDVFAAPGLLVLLVEDLPAAELVAVV